MKLFRTILFLAALCLAAPLCGAPSGQEQADSAIVKKAKYIAGLAQRDLSLSPDETSFLEGAFYDRYYAGQERIKDVDDQAKVAEIKKEIHKEFSSVVYKHYGREKSAEIIAWYYNYTNKKR